MSQTTKRKQHETTSLARNNSRGTANANSGLEPTRGGGRARGFSSQRFDRRYLWEEEEGKDGLVAKSPALLKCTSVAVCI